MENIVGEVLRGLRLGKVAEFRNMAIVPICHDNDIVGGYMRSI
jgi:hypothetical protein